MSDDSDTLESEAIKQIESAVFRKIFFVVLAGAIGLGSYISFGPGIRPDPFTGHDGDDLREEIERYVTREIEHAVILLRTEMPPTKTKAKIRALEASAARTDPEFVPKYEGW